MNLRHEEVTGTLTSLEKILLYQIRFFINLINHNSNWTGTRLS